MRADSTKKRPGDGAFFLFWRSFVSFRAPRDSGAGVGGAVGVRSLASRRAQARHLEPAKGLVRSLASRRDDVWSLRRDVARGHGGAVGHENGRAGGAAQEIRFDEDVTVAVTPGTAAYLVVGEFADHAVG